ncbi:PREDICTED: protein S100-A9 [Elephantulus edwardii]|uniref:protein S100-A9 n=1 Tax=Elephantulus edwardii TaxID=28737 RepID=UPI0003F085FE|nr:PREDICTED: protein S100-A9 [Elephantulus edwardii]
MSQLERNVETIINIFHQYSTRLGHPDTLNQSEFKQLVNKELANFLKKENRNERVISDIMEDLDTNGDQQLNFEEYIILVARLTNASHEEMHKNVPPGTGHSHGPGLGEGGACPGQRQDPGRSHGHGHGHSHGHGHAH